MCNNDIAQKILGKKRASNTSCAINVDTSPKRLKKQKILVTTTTTWRI